MIDIDSEMAAKFMENLTKIREEEKVKEQNILMNNGYMNNLVQKLKINMYVISNNDKEDSYNTYYDLPILYKLVDNYAKDNNLSPLCQKYYEVYYLKYNDYIFSIFRKKKDRKITYGCYPIYLKKNDLPYCIDFLNIKNNVNGISNFCNGLVGQLKDLVDLLYKEGFPLHFIQQLVDNIVEDKRKNGDENVYQKK